MASNRKRTKAIRNRKTKPNQENLKKDALRIDRNREILNESAAREKA